ncbi:helix-turn-helix domain-containing protein [Mucilaginibacter jinjuensis]|uniref:Helix-turn-helix transcriptional regulator n=1 Tax=Mucilaginibacter jinjuensis TaxID=1176721 RepID=A0ABY7TG91_9SPHI|nr:helix-turn-helix transcriptional regulator [Mucilaginibacter jinjuensis]WCT14738.1 helix-turn-helix transcriptional regulator [Mucilaginibacter jinjuensis]
MSDNQHDIFFARIEQNIRQHAKHQRITLSELAAGIDMTEAGFYKMLSTESIKVKTLRKIAEFLKIPIHTFFGEFVSPRGSAQSPSWKPDQIGITESHAEYAAERDGLKRQIELLESQIADKNKIIELLSR